MSSYFLSPNFCKEIKNVLSYFLDVNMSFINMCIVSLSRILEGIDQRDGLASEMNLQKGSILFHNNSNIWECLSSVLDVIVTNM